MTTNLLTPKSTFSELFEVILNGNKEDSRRSARKVRKYLYSSHDSGEYKIIKSIIETAPEEYLDIVEDWRQENFIVSVSVLYFLHDKENKPDFLFPWLFRLLQHKNGNIRQSAVRMITTELGPLTVHIRCPEYQQSKLKSEQSDVILSNVFITLNELLMKHWISTYKKYKYISSLPACPYKSIQMVLSEMEDDCGKVYMKQLKNRLSRHR
ncbi:MAG: hypothetical protein ABIH67_04840 [Candidatus Uhrbacteria bacterium]